MSIRTDPIAADLTLRPAILDDATFAADMWTAVRPSSPEDPVAVRYWWEHPWDDSLWERYVAARGGDPAGYVAMRDASRTSNI